MWFIPLVHATIQTLPFKPPSQCELNRCLSNDTSYCISHLEGFFYWQRACPTGTFCTNCIPGSSIQDPMLCYCEQPPYSTSVVYGQPCDYSRVCGSGQGDCFRPCSTYLHVTQCPTPRCSWSFSDSTCSSSLSTHFVPSWNVLAFIGIIYRDEETRGNMIVSGTPSSVFPLSFKDMSTASHGYRINGLYRIESQIKLSTLFLLLDVNTDGAITMDEFSSLSSILKNVETQVQRKYGSSGSGSTGVIEASSRRLAGLLPVIDQSNIGLCLAITNSTEPAILEACQAPELQGDICNVDQGKVYCPLDSSCKPPADCSTCGWQTAVDLKLHKCVSPTPTSCKSENGKHYCPADEMCHSRGDCSHCTGFTAIDSVQGVCIAEWWGDLPSDRSKDWVCRYRRKVGQPCFNDMDCVYGQRKCDVVSGKCLALPAYDPAYPCSLDLDCEHLGYYCPDDPTGGEDPYWTKYCRKQKVVGQQCGEDRECSPFSKCNILESPPRCRGLFTLEIGSPAVTPELCISSFTDANDYCAVAGKSKDVGRACGTSDDCITTDVTGKTGECSCKLWWQSEESKYCMPVAGDFSNHFQTWRNYLFQTATYCGLFWTEEECQEFRSEVRSSFYRMKCEEQRLVLGPYLPPSSCGLSDYDKFPDYCNLVLSADKSNACFSVSSFSSFGISVLVFLIIFLVP